MGKYYSRDETEFGAFGDAPSRFGASVATTADFMTGGTIKAPAAQAPALTPAQIKAAAAGRAAFNANVLRTTAATTAARNVPYTATRAANDRAAIAASNAIAKQPWNTANIDWGLLPAAGAITVAALAPVAIPAIAAAAGPVVAAAAPIVTAAAPVIKAIKSSPAAAATVKSADRLLATADTATAAGAKARDTLNTTIKASAAGNAKATEGLAVLAVVAADRAATGTPAGAASRAAFAPAELLTPPLRAAPPIVRPAAPPPSIYTTIKLSPDETAAALASLSAANSAAPTDPKYLVLDSGQVLSSVLARQSLPGWLVRFDGRVVRQ